MAWQDELAQLGKDAPARRGAEPGEWPGIDPAKRRNVIGEQDDAEAYIAWLYAPKEHGR